MTYSGYPRFAAESHIRGFLKELDFYSSVFHIRITKAFDGLEDEAEKIREQEYDEMASSCSNPEYADPSRAAEKAYFAGVDFYLATDEIRQGLFNLMIAGLFHHVEQQSQFLAKELRYHGRRHFPQPDPRKGGFDQLKAQVKENKEKAFAVDLESFKSWTAMNELRLVANVVKHGDGRSAQELVANNPDLFKDPINPSRTPGLLPLRPLIGEGLRLTPEHFNKYKACIEQFWDELTTSLVPVFCSGPAALTASPSPG